MSSYPKADRTEQRRNKIMRQWVDALILMHGLTPQAAVQIVGGILNDSMPPVRGTRVVADATKAQAAPIVRQYQQAYRAKYGEDPQVYGQEVVNLHKLIGKHGPELVSRRLNAFFAWEDPWVANTAGYTLGTFFKQWDKLAQHCARRVSAPVVTCKHTPRCHDAKACSQKFLAEHRLSSTGTGS